MKYKEKYKDKNYHEKYRQKNIDKIKKYETKRYKQNREKLLLQQKKYNKQNREKKLERDREYNKINKHIKRKRFDSFLDWPFETCKYCGNRIIPGYSVNNELWEKVVKNSNICICLPCFDRAAQKKQIEYTIDDIFFISWMDILPPI